MMFKLPNLLLLFDVILVHEYCTYYQRLVLLSLFENHFDQCPTPQIYVHVQPGSHDSANHNIVKFIREKKSPEGKSVEFFIRWCFRKIPSCLREAQIIYRTKFQTFHIA